MSESYIMDINFDGHLMYSSYNIHSRIAKELLMCAFTFNEDFVTPMWF